MLILGLQFPHRLKLSWFKQASFPIQLHHTRKIPVSLFLSLCRSLVASLNLPQFCLFNRLWYIRAPLVSSSKSEVLLLTSSHGTFPTTACKLGCHRKPTVLSDVLTRHRGIIILTLLWGQKKTQPSLGEKLTDAHTQWSSRTYTHWDWKITLA